MRKTILIVLLVLLAFTIWSVLAFGKAKKGEEARQPAEIEKAAPGPAPEDFPEVVLPKPRPVRPTAEDFQTALDKKGKTPEQMKELQGKAVPMELESQPQKAPYFCEVRNQVGGAYYRPGGDWNLYCWGQLGLATLLNLDYNYWTDCPYPLYPFEITDVAVQVYASNVCTIVSEGRIYTVDYSTGCTYPNQQICTGGPQTDAHPGAFLWIVIPVDPPCCVYDEFFVAWMFNNSDDFNDIDYCSPTQFVDLSLIFDASGRTCQSYWGPYAEYTGEPYYGWFDVVPNGLWPGALRIEVLGYTADQNECPDPHETWYFKPAFDDYPEHYAPSGMPDFYQYQDFFLNNGMAYCGPTAGANSIWWFAASSEFDLPWEWEPDFPHFLIEELAAVANTDQYLGTECDTLQKAILDLIKAYGGWWFYETTVYAPDFWYLQKELRACEDVILLLGFWQLDPAGEWSRFGGHFVTLAGIDIFNLAFAFSDPAMGTAENGWGPGFTGAGMFLAHLPPPPPIHENPPVPDPPFTPLGVHNDAGNVSHDVYFPAWPSPSPGGFIYLPDYVVGDVIADTTEVCDTTILKKNHFKTWRLEPQTFDRTVHVWDQFMQDSLRLVSIDFFSNPAGKEHLPYFYDILDSTHHLTWYRAEGKDTSFQVKYQNQIETELTEVTLDSVMYLLVPTQKVEPVYHEPPEDLDHYKAYRIQDSNPIAISLVIWDQFDVLYGSPEFIEFLRARYFLTPASKDSSVIYDDITHYVAYEFVPKRLFPLPIYSIDQFGTHFMYSDSSWFLLVPTNKCHKVIEYTYIPKWDLFQDQNFRTEHEPFRGTYDPALEVYVEIEQAIVVSPGPKEMSDCVYSSKVYECENNHGGIEAFEKDFDGSGYDASELYYGSLLLGTNQGDLACDYGDYYPLHTFEPLGPPVCTSFTKEGTAGTYTIEQCTYEFAHPFIDGLVITKYAFGFWVPIPGGTEECEQVVEDVFVIHNTGTSTIECLEKGVWLDYDVEPDYNDLSDGNEQYQSKWMWNPADPTRVYGLTKKPMGTRAITGWGLSQAARVYDGQYMDSLKYWMENLGWGDDNFGVPEDKSIMIIDSCFNLAPGEMHLNKFLKWGYHGPILTGGIDPAWKRFLYLVLHQEGFYRGDVNQDGWLSVADVVYLINYLFKGGPAPIEFKSQGDVNCDYEVSIADVVYLINYMFKGGRAPIDKNRFLLNSPFVDPAHKALGIRDPGLFGDPQWDDLGH